MSVATTQLSKHEPAGRPWFFWFVVAAGAVTIFLFVVNVAVAYRYGRWDKFGYGVAGRSDGIYVAWVDKAGPAGALQVGDKILTVTDAAGTIPVRRTRSLKYRFHSAPAGTRYTLRVVREGREVEVAALVAVHRSVRPDDPLRGIFSALFSALPFAAVGLLIGLVKPHDRDARRACLTMLSFALNYLYIGVIDYSVPLLTGFWRAAWLGHFLVSGATIFIALAYHLYYRFPADAPTSRGWTAMQWCLYGCGGAIYLSGCVPIVMFFVGTEISAGWIEFFHGIRQFNEVYMVLGLAATCLVAGRNYRLVREPGPRNRIKLVIYSSLATFISNIIYYLIRLVGSVAGLDETKLEWFVAGLNALRETAPLLVALAWGYAILKHRVLEIDLVIRRGVQYLLAKNVLRVLLVLPLLGLAVRLSLNPQLTFRELLFAQPLNLVLAALAALSLKLRPQLLDRLDRRFFREAYRQEQVLLRLIERIDKFAAPAELVAEVERQLERALHPTGVQVYLRDYAPSAAGAPLPPDAQLLREFAGAKAACEYTAELRAALPADERAWLERLGTHLLVPINGADGHWFGWLLLGEKKSEVPYTRQDRGLLLAVARQIALVCEHFQLTGRMERETKIKHEVLAQLEPQRINLVKECPLCGCCFDQTVSHCPTDGEPLTLSLPVERTLDGKYRLERLIGKGGMGAVYAATDVRLKREVAVKILTGSLFGNRDARQRFAREARTLARLSHPQIVAVHDYGEAGAEGAYLVMELLRGVSLRTELKQRGALPPPLAAEWFEQILAGVEAAHQAGAIHRDLKPENVLLVSQPDGGVQLKLLDFGVVKLRPTEAFGPTGNERLTMPGMLIGTPAYMAPEQLAGREADERADIFALGVMVVEAITGKRPFTGKNHQELLAAIWLQQPYRLPGAGPEPLNAVLRKCLALERGDRYATVGALRAALIPALAECRPWRGRVSG